MSFYGNTTRWMGEAFSRDHIVAMDRRAVAALSAAHPERDLATRFRAELQKRLEKIQGQKEAQRDEIERARRERIEFLERRMKAAREADLKQKQEAAGYQIMVAKAYAIRGEIARKHGLTENDLQSHSRERQRLVPARQEAIYLIACETVLSLPRIAKIFGGRDHTTILHSIRKHAERIGVDPPRGIPPLKGGKR